MNKFETLPVENTLTPIQLRQQLGAVLERVYYQFQQFRIVRKDKPMARLVSEDFMQVIDQLIEEDPALADTIALKMNDEWQTAMTDSVEDFQAGRFRLLERRK
jgi:Lhr-like helicase